MQRLGQQTLLFFGEDIQLPLDLCIDDIQPLIDNVEPFAQLLLGNAKRRVDEKGVPAHKGK